MENKKLLSIPHLTTRQIKVAADGFRTQYSKQGVIPIEIEKIIDFQLGIEIVPQRNLRQICDIDAYITSNMRSIFVDQQTYDNDRMQSRIRFSLAHEIGHFVMHQKAYTSLNITTQEEYYHFTQSKNTETCTFHDDAERQARIFANILLVPREELLKRKNKLLEENADKLKQAGIEDTPSLNDFLAIPLAKEFRVSEHVLIIALNYLASDLSLSK